MKSVTGIPAEVNAHLFNWGGPLGLPEYDKFSAADFAAGFDWALAAHLEEIDAIANNPEAPDFQNTIVALELDGLALNRISRIFWNLAGAHTNPEIQALEREISPKMSRHMSQISQNRKLFERIDAVYQKKETLDLSTEALRVLEQKWKNLVRAGANLDSNQQDRLAEMKQRLASLYTEFGQNVLADESEFILVIDDEDDLAGLPDFLVSNMASAASEKGHPGKHAVTLSRSIIEPFLSFSDRRELREAAFGAWVARGEGDNDNRPLVKEMIALRAEVAELLGYESFAAYKLEQSMAKTPGNVTQLLNTVWEKARSKAKREAGDLKEVMASEGANHALEPWDWRYYSEKLRVQKYDFDEAEVKSYFQLDNIIQAAFDTATRLFGVTFSEVDKVTTWHEDVRVFEVMDKSGQRIAVFTGDYFARSSKRSGAWMSGLSSQHKLDGGEIPIIMNTMNFAKAAPGEPVLISMTDANTLFHEFGHALHGMLSDVTYPSVSGTAVYRDWVELPSQLYEHWLTVPETLKTYAVHHQTGEAIPQKLVDKLLAAETFDSGFDNVEFTSSALVDMAFHTLTAEEAKSIDPMAKQAEVLDQLEMPSEIVMRHATPHFQHVFSGDGYSAGYYSYMWSGVLDADAFRAFKDAGDPFDAQTAERLLEHVYSSGDSVDPEDAYVAYRGALPTPDALLEKRGLI